MDTELKMQYRTLGRSGLKISRFGYGNWVNSNKEDPKTAQEKANALVKLAFDSGINYFDTAEAYGAGDAERQLGVSLKALNVPRSDYVVSTKLFWGQFPDNTNGHNNRGTSRKRIFEGLDRSLKNLQLEYVDIILCHRYDDDTPTIEIVQAFKDILAAGKALYWGTSTWPAVRVMEAMLLCDIVGCPRPIVEQCQYSLLERDPIEKNYCELFDDYGLGTTTFSPLCSGILTGKYNEGIPEGSRFHTAKNYLFIYNQYLSEGKKEKTIAKLRALASLSERVGCSMAQLCIAWNLHSKNVTACILGASSLQQLQENLDALKAFDKLDRKILDEVEEIMQNRPDRGTHFRNGGNHEPRR